MNNVYTAHTGSDGYIQEVKMILEWEWRSRATKNETQKLSNTSNSSCLSALLNSRRGFTLATILLTASTYLPI